MAFQFLTTASSHCPTDAHIPTEREYYAIFRVQYAKKQYKICGGLL